MRTDGSDKIGREGEGEIMSLHPPLSVADDLTKAFWEGVKQGKLLVQRCAECRRYQFPPHLSCESCSSARVSLVGMVRLDEQEDLIFASNFESKYADLMIGAPVEVEFQERAQGTVIPQFRLCTTRQMER
jgi:uncharacterized OB-fold protein